MSVYPFAQATWSGNAPECQTKQELEYHCDQQSIRSLPCVRGIRRHAFGLSKQHDKGESVPFRQLDLCLPPAYLSK